MTRPPLPLVSIAWLCAGALLLAGCGRGPASPRATLEKNLQMMEDFSASLEKAQSADDVAAALDRYTRSMEQLGPQLEALKKTHPELSQMDRDGTLPAEFKDLEDQFNAAGMKMMSAMMKVMQYHGDPKVQEAQKRMIAVAEKLH